MAKMATGKEMTKARKKAVLIQLMVLSGTL
jgi:hypothetical protein